MAICSLASSATMVQLVGTDLGVMVLLVDLVPWSEWSGLEKSVRFDMASFSWKWLCWPNQMALLPFCLFVTTHVVIVNCGIYV